MSTYALIVGMLLVLFLLANTLLFEERPTVIVNVAKDISISTLCFGVSSLCLLSPMFGVAMIE